MKRIETDGLIFYQHQEWSNLKHGIFTRHGGVSQAPWDSLNTGGTVGDDDEAVRHNHQLIYDTLDMCGENACTTWQVHGADVVTTYGAVENRRWVARADGIITNQADVPLVMRYADCVPILYFDPVQRAIGLAHAGWRGTVQGMASNMVLALQQTFGSHPKDIQTIIGPSISRQHFQVGEEVVEAVRTRFGTLDGLMERDSDDDTAYVDLWEANRRELLDVGVEQIYITQICTYTNHTDFFSHRADKGKTGRFGVVISL